MEPKQSSPRTRDAVLLTLFTVLILMQRAHLYGAPLFGDICAYAVIGHEMLHGRQLYSDLWERKPPLLYVTYSAAECIAGYGRGEIFLLSSAAAIASLLLIYFAAGAGARSRAAGLFAAGFWVLLNCDLDLTANQPDPETFINVCMIAVFVVLMRWNGRRRFIVAISLGAVLSAATLYKHNTALACLALLIGHVLIPGTGRILRRMLDALIAGLMMVATWSIIFAYFAATGRSRIFTDVLFHQNFSYSRDMTGNLTRSVDLHHFLPPFMLWLIAPMSLCLLLAACAAARRSAQPSRPWLLLLAWAIGTSATIALTGYLYPHYYQLWLPIGCIGGGWAAAGLVQKPRPISPVIGYSGVVICFGFLLFRQGSEFLLTPGEWVHRQFQYFDVPEQNRLGVQLGQLLQPDEQFFELGEDNALYFFSKHSPPSGLLFIDPYIFGDETDAYWTRLLKDLNRTRPALVILSDSWTPMIPADAPIYPWLNRFYIPWETPIGWPHYHLLLRRGGSLQQRVNPATAFSSAPPAADAQSLPVHH